MAVDYKSMSYTMEDELIDLLDQSESDDFNINFAKRDLVVQVALGKAVPDYYGYGVIVHTQPKVERWVIERPYVEHPWDDEE
jgi:hypothetical protein